MPSKDIIVIGASTGGIEALQILASGLPSGLNAAIFVVLHISPYSPNILDSILSRAGPLPAVNARNWEQIKAGCIYVAPADHHLTLEPSGYMRLTRGPKENRFRPAVDVLFRSAAQAFGPRVTGVILTGWLDDGTAGVWAIKEQGGIAVVQHPEEAIAPDMPLNAIKHVEVQHILPLKQIAPLLVRLSTAPAEEKGAKPVSKQMETEVKIAQEDKAIKGGITEWGEPSIYACPECHGVLLQIKEGSNVRFRCHTGHAYSLESLLSEFTEQTEETLWSAIRSIEETVLLMRGMAEHLSGHEHADAAAALLKKADEAQQRSDQVRKLVMQHENVTIGERESSVNESEGT